MALLGVFFQIQLHAASVLDTTFNIGSGANGLVEQVLPLSNGKILICGNFTTFNGQNKAYIARLNADGSVDATFTGTASYWVRNMSVQGDGKIVIGGFFRHVGGQPRSLIARLNADGSLDPTFNPGTGATDLIAGGIDGNMDPFVFWTAVQPDGKILATGNFRNYNGASSVGLVRINPDGSRDASFNVGGGLDSWGRHILVLPNSQILVSGWFGSYRGVGFNRIARINPDGSPDTSFTPFFGDRTAIYSTALLSNGKYMAAGHSLNTNGLFLREFARLHPNGVQDESFVGYSNEKTESVIVQPDGKVIIGGYFNAVNGQRRTAVARLHPEGQLDTGWFAEIDNFVWSCAFQTDGKLLISGGFYTVDGQSRRGVARLITGATGAPPPPPPPPPPTPTGGSATYVATDSTTGGTWKGTYGADGYNVIGNAAAYPSYAQVTPGNKQDWTWSWSTTDTAALQKANATDRLAACWYSGVTWSMDVAITDGQTHRIALYFLDWDNAGRRQVVQAINPATGAVLDQRTVSGFQRGVYLVFDVSGTVRFNITPQVSNAVLSGIFFGASATPPPPQTVATPTISPNGGTFTSAQSVTLATATSGAEIRYTTNGSEPSGTSTLYSAPFTVGATATVKAKAFKSGMTASATASATFTINTGGGGGGGGSNWAFVTTDTSTKGNWRGVYGADGYNVIGSSSSYPAYASIAAAGKQDWTWNSTTTDARGLQTPSGTSRIGACWYSGSSFTIDLSFNDTATHRVALYFCDWDYAGRAQTVELIDAATGGVVQTQTLSNFAGGQYLVWDLKGRFRVRITKTIGPNAVVNGLFLSPSPRAL